MDIQPKVMRHVRIIVTERTFEAECFDFLGEHPLHGLIDFDEIGAWLVQRNAGRLCAGDSVGVFQVESRAQIATLPRLRPILRQAGCCLMRRLSLWRCHLPGHPPSCARYLSSPSESVAATSTSGCARPWLLGNFRQTPCPRHGYAIPMTAAALGATMELPTRSSSSLAPATYGSSHFSAHQRVGSRAGSVQLDYSDRARTDR